MASRRVDYRSERYSSDDDRPARRYIKKEGERYSTQDRISSQRVERTIEQAIRVEEARYYLVRETARYPRELQSYLEPVLQDRVQREQIVDRLAELRRDRSRLHEAATAFLIILGDLPDDDDGDDDDFTEGAEPKEQAYDTNDGAKEDEQPQKSQSSAVKGGEIKAALRPKLEPPVYTRMARRHLSIETLRELKIDYTLDTVR
jgi:hypothetical protein